MLPKRSAILPFIPFLSGRGTITVVFIVSKDRRLRKRCRYWFARVSGDKEDEQSGMLRVQIGPQKEEAWKRKTEKENG